MKSPRLMPIHYMVGDRVQIENTTLLGKPIVEGEAKLVQFVSKEQEPPYYEYWKVVFPGESTMYLRRINPYQAGQEGVK